MLRALVLAAGPVLLTAPARSDDTIPSETVDAVKKATVFIRVQGKTLRNKWSASGSGFVVAAETDSVLVATNYHVIRLPQFETRRPSPADLAASLNVPAVYVVFDGGTKTEQVVKAEAVAADPEADLAILRITDLKNPPAPIDLAGNPKLSETMSVYTFGFPFGQSLSTTKGNPAITVGKGSISSLRNDENGELAVVQIDGALNPGNSGGPVVDSKGKLVGVAVATIRNGQGIGFAVPAAEVTKVMKGRLGAVAVTTTRKADGKLTARAEVGVIDPSSAIREVTLHYLVVGPNGKKPERGEPLEKHPDAKKVTLKVEGLLAAGELPVDAANGELYVQAVPDGGLGIAGMSKVRTVALAAAAPKVEPKTGVGTRPAPRPTPGVPVAAGRGPRIQGGGTNEFRDHAPKDGLLVGLEVGLGKFVNNDIIVAVRPTYRVGDKEVPGEWCGTDNSLTSEVKAKPGYAIGAITLKTGLGIDGLSVTFMKVVNGKLDPKDSYESEWLGGKGGFGQVKIGDGTPVVGLLGRTNEKDVQGLGLIYTDTAKKDAPWPAGKPTRIQGGGDTEFRDGAPAGGLLVGLEVGLGKFVNNDIVVAVRPIYRVGEKESFGEQHGTDTRQVVKVVAKPGYAVAAISVKTGLGVDGLSLTFMKVADGKLDAKDSYESEWVGGMGGGGPVKLGGNQPVVGLAGKTNNKNDVTGLGLLLKDNRK